MQFLVEIYVLFLFNTSYFLVFTYFSRYLSKIRISFHSFFLNPGWYFGKRVYKFILTFSPIFITTISTTPNNLRFYFYLASATVPNTQTTPSSWRHHLSIFEKIYDLSSEEESTVVNYLVKSCSLKKYL